ncbi:MAG TPA: HDOD domain-containing protein [Candidatus Hydrogenedentes bacterium]|mgnify:CR=1 FL=1|nr:HDOD domain-containing protein [Candidatus Hydrogenedentota bacterium]HPC15333.1 HDOD domain-containing protein [Candidatus Hydrogenedentota bacterium]HRT19288.1 HDOD domain-containing protein [Candidatus Hydrogenedentota bacterium]HRT63368.1 HDOD domain-containing protein [Candidatus Hydrogenedentota bacterium]
MPARQERLEAIIESVGELPALPGIVADVLAITEDPAVAVSRISECVQRDPGLAAKILKVANSPHYGMKQYVSTLKLAIVILGIREVRNIVLGISLFETLQDGRVERTLAREIWAHSLQVAAWCRMIGASLNLGLQGEDFIGGLLHDIGKIVLLRQIGGDYFDLIKRSGGHGEVFCQMETNIFGFDHAGAAEALATHWNLPQSLSDALWMHHAAPERRLDEAAHPSLAALVRVANVAACEDFSETVLEPPPSCMLEEAWSALDSPKAPKDPVGRYVLLSGFAAEIQEMPLLFL